MRYGVMSAFDQLRDTSIHLSQAIDVDFFMPLLIRGIKPCPCFGNLLLLPIRHCVTSTHLDLW